MDNVLNVHASFDTLVYANKLKQVGMPDKQAEMLAELQSTLSQDSSRVNASKQDVENAKSELKGDVENAKSELKGDMARLEATLIKWVVGIALGQVALIVSLIKFIH